MNKEKEVKLMQIKSKNIGVRLMVISYIGNCRFQKEKEIFSVRQLYNLLRKIKDNLIIYGISVGENTIIVHLFLDRPSSIKGNDVGEQKIERG